MDHEVSIHAARHDDVVGGHGGGREAKDAFPIAAARLARVGPAHRAGLRIERVQPGSRLPRRRKPQ